MDPDLVLTSESTCSDSANNPACALLGNASSGWRTAGTASSSPRCSPPLGTAKMDAVLAESDLIIDATSDSVWASSNLSSIEQDDQADKPIADQLEAYHMLPEEFRRLNELRDPLATNNSLTLEEWKDVYSIVLQACKRKKFDAWRREEILEGVVLDPNQFNRPVSLADFLPAQASTTQAPQTAGGGHDLHEVFVSGLDWRVDYQARLDWAARLNARHDALDGVETGLAKAIANVEEATRPMLRDALLKQLDTDNTGSVQTLDDKADWFTEKYFIDAKEGGSVRLPRLSQAILTAQLILQRARRGDLGISALSAPNLVPSQFDRQWTWLRSYKKWKSAILLYLYPENFLHPSLRRKKTPAFRALEEGLRQAAPVDEKAACDLVADYQAYFDDVRDLEPVASCRAWTNTQHEQTDSSCGCGDPKTGADAFYYMIARGGETGRIYWSRYREERGEQAAQQTFWTPIEALEGYETVKVHGAVPYFPTGKPLGEKSAIYLFVTAVPDGAAGDKGGLGFVRYRLDTARWDKKFTGLKVNLDNGGASQISASEIADFKINVFAGGSASSPPTIIVGNTGRSREQATTPSDPAAADEEQQTEFVTVRHGAQQSRVAHVATGIYVRSLDSTGDGWSHTPWKTLWSSHRKQLSVPRRTPELEPARDFAPTRWWKLLHSCG